MAKLHAHERGAALHQVCEPRAGEEIVQVALEDLELSNSQPFHPSWLFEEWLSRVSTAQSHALPRCHGLNVDLGTLILEGRKVWRPVLPDDIQGLRAVTFKNWPSSAFHLDF